MTSTFEFFSGVREKVRAWEECTDCNDKPIPQAVCPNCHGSGGRWHEGVYSRQDKVLMVPKKDGFLTRTHEICGKCYIPLNHNVAVQVDSTKRCDHCKGTGCEPGTASEWEVK